VIAWDKFGQRWLGITSRCDEALAGVRMTVGLTFRNMFLADIPVSVPSSDASPTGWLR